MGNYGATVAYHPIIGLKALDGRVNDLRADC
jgi:hypothetical protein